MDTLGRGLRIVLLLLMLSSCRGEPVMPDRSLWNGAVELPNGISAPLRMSLDFSGARPAGYFLVGDEQTAVPEISRNGNTLVLGFSEYSTEMLGTWTGGRLIGTYRRIRSDGTKSLKFTASPETGAVNPPAAATLRAPLPTGNYQVLFQGEEKVNDTTTAKFWMVNNDFHGTFIAPDGDYGLLVGAPSGERIQLSRFTGWQVIALVLEHQAGTWSGQFHAAHNDMPRSFTLQPRADLNVEVPASKRTAMKDPNAVFEFSCLSLSGETVRHSDERFKGKALIVDIMGTWCHNCLDEAPVLQDLQEQFGKNGFEVVGLSFEITDDSSLGRKNLQLYRDRFGLTYPLLFCGSLDDDNVNKQINTQLINFFAYPTAIFVDKNHKVQAIHSGFKGPGTGDQFQAQIREFQELSRRLVE